MALVNTSLSSNAQAFRSFDRSFNSFPSAKHSNSSNLGKTTKMNRLLWTRAIKDIHSSCLLPTMTLYDVLCVSESAELGDVKKAYREKVRIYHPDVCPAAEKEKCGKMFLLVQEAYETLSDPMLRADYDLKLLLSPQLLLSKRRNVKQPWTDQLEGLRMSRRRGRGRHGERECDTQEKKW